MRAMFEPKEGTNQPMDGIDVPSHAEIDHVVNYMRMGMHHRVAAKKGRAMVTSPHWWDEEMLVTGKYEKDEFVARVMGHIADQYDEQQSWWSGLRPSGAPWRNPWAALQRHLTRLRLLTRVRCRLFPCSANP